MLVFDVTDINSFLKVQGKGEPLEGMADWSAWLDEIHRLAPDDVRIIIVGTKKDMEKKRMVELKEAQDVAAKHGVEYVETSSKTGENVDHAFMALANLCYKVT